MNEDTKLTWLKRVLIFKILVVALLLAVVLIAGFAVAALVERGEQAQASSEAFNRLRLFHNLRKAALED